MPSSDARPRILVVDDEPGILTSIRDLLEDDFTVYRALDGGTALGLLEQEEIAVVLSDQRMPGSSGDLFLQRAAEISQATRILITAYADIDALVRAVNHGQIYAYIAKPWDPIELKVTVLRAAHHYELMREVGYERDLLQALMSNSPDRIYFKDAELRFTRVNPPHARFLGLSDPRAAIGKTDFDFLPQPYARQAQIEEEQILRSGAQLMDREEPVPGSGDPPRWFSSTKVPIPNHRRADGIVAIARDITERKAAEQELRRARDELGIRVRERTAEVSRLNQALEERIRELTAANRELEAFAYSTSHDLRAPLRHIDAFSMMMLENFGPKLPAEVRQRLGHIRREISGMSRMIDGLLNLSRLRRREPVRQTISLRSLVEEVLAELAPERAGRDIRIELGDLPSADCDPELMRAVLRNLLSNAMKFTRPREQAVIEIGQVDCQGRRAVFVRDNGVGFNMNYAAKLFGVFQRLHRREDFEGTGVGLAIVQRIIQRHGGEVWAQAEENQGATFYFTLA